jgi:hypothetical protein
MVDVDAEDDEDEGLVDEDGLPYEAPPKRRRKRPANATLLPLSDDDYDDEPVGTTDDLGESDADSELGDEMAAAGSWGNGGVGGDSNNSGGDGSDGDGGGGGDEFEEDDDFPSDDDGAAPAVLLPKVGEVWLTDPPKGDTGRVTVIKIGTLAEDYWNEGNVKVSYVGPAKKCVCNAT